MKNNSKEVLDIYEIEESIDIYNFVINSCTDFIEKGLDHKIYYSDDKRYKREITCKNVYEMLEKATRSLNHYLYLKDQHEDMNKDFYNILLLCAAFRNKYGSDKIGKFTSWVTFNNVFATKHTKLK